MKGRTAVVWIAIVALLLLAGWLGGPPRRGGRPLDPRSDDPLGTSAVVEVARRLGADVSISDGIPGADHDVALLLRDRLDDADRGALRRWVERGGTLVVADPSSSFAPPQSDAALFPGAVADGAVPPGDCTIDAIAPMRAFDSVAGIRFEVPRGARSCFGDGETAHVVDIERAGGHVVAFGGAAAFTNGELDRADNGPVIAALLVPRRGADLRVLELPRPGEGQRTLGDLIEPNVRRGLVQLVVAFGVYAIHRARRLGRPVAEAEPIEIAGSELVAARGELLHQSRSPSHAAAAMRAQLRRELGQRLGVPTTLEPGAFADVVAARVPVDRDRLHEVAIDRAVADDAELVALARSIESIRQEVLHGHAAQQGA